MVSYWIPMLLGTAVVAVLVIIPVTTTFDGERLNCGAAIWSFVPSDPIGLEGREYEEFMACKRAGVAHGVLVFGLSIASVVAGLVHARIYLHRRYPWTRQPGSASSSRSGP